MYTDKSKWIGLEAKKTFYCFTYVLLFLERLGIMTVMPSGLTNMEL